MENPRKLIIANWKSHHTSAIAENWLENCTKLTQHSPYNLAVCPPFTLLETMHRAITKTQSHISLGMQNISAFPSGSYTGEISAENIAGFGVQYVILGHSERRTYCHETSAEVAQKIENALQNNLTPIVCIHENNMKEQAALLDSSVAEKIFFAFEDPQHIGTGTPSAIQSVETVIRFLRQHLDPNVSVLYGGSAHAATAKQFLLHPEISGLLIGSASLSAESFSDLANLI